MVDGCDQPMRKRNWCASHYAQWKRFGEVRPFTYKWAAEKQCVVCGATDWPGKGRKVCSGKCQQLLARSGGRPIPREAMCARCGASIDLTQTGKAGRKKRADTKLCHRCWSAKCSGHALSVGQLAQRDGTDCGICGRPVDMTLTAPDEMRASVDHVIPRARGGSDDPENLQLAHLRCNHIKSDRIVGVVILPT